MNDSERDFIKLQIKTLTESNYVPDPIIAKLPGYETRAKIWDWFLLKKRYSKVDILTIYLTPEGATVYATFDIKTLNLISNVDRSVK